MTFPTLWQRLFPSNDQAREIAWHVAQATGGSYNPFRQLVVYRNEFASTEEFIEKWVRDFWRLSPHTNDKQTIASYAQAARAVTPAIVRQLLGDADWRARMVGAYFAAIKGYEEFTDMLGGHLLQSQVASAGAIYALALSLFAQERARDYLKAYLEFYLKQQLLWLDQAEVLAALQLIAPAEAAAYSARWAHYTLDKPGHLLENALTAMSRSREIVAQISAASLR